MSCLDATFTLTPQFPWYEKLGAPNDFAFLACYGADFWPGAPADFSSLYASNRFFFHSDFAADPTVNYVSWASKKKTRFLLSYFHLSSYGAAHKQLALIFGFDVLDSANPGRVLIYTNAALLKDQQLVYGDNQFLLEIEYLDQPLGIYFIHAGGYWFFTGLSGYVV